MNPSAPALHILYCPSPLSLLEIQAPAHPVKFRPALLSLAAASSQQPAASGGHTQWDLTRVLARTKWCRLQLRGCWNAMPGGRRGPGVISKLPAGCRLLGHRTGRVGASARRRSKRAAHTGSLKWRGGSYGQQRVRSRVSLSLPPPPPRAQMQLARRCTAHGALFSRAGTGRLGRRATAGRRPEPRLYTRRRPPRRQAGPWGGQTWPSPTHGAPPPQVCSQCVWCITQGRRCPGR